MLDNSLGEGVKGRSLIMKSRILSGNRHLRLPGRVAGMAGLFARNPQVSS